MIKPCCYTAPTTRMRFRDSDATAHTIVHQKLLRLDRVVPKVGEKNRVSARL